MEQQFTPESERHLILCVGELSKEIFDALEEGMIGEIVQTFTNSAYLKTIEGELICLTFHQTRAPMNVNVNAAESWPREGSIAYKQGQTLKIREFQLDFTNPPIYKCKTDYVMANGIEERLKEAATALSILDVKGSILDSRSIFYQRLSEGIKRIAYAVQETDFKELQRAIPGIIGLGPGSTPSGDDFLAGLLFCLNKILVLKGHHPQVFNIRGETSWPSKKFIEYAQSGYVSEPLENLVYALLCGSHEGVSSNIADMSRVGHSSGIDASVGALIAACYGKKDTCLSSMSRIVRF